MNVEIFLTNVVLILIFIGLPVIPLLFIATELGRWYRENPDPPGVEGQSHDH